MGLSWFGIFRLGAIQTALGAIVVLCLSVMNRVMVVELALAASVPGFLVSVHHAVQLSRPAWGFRSDQGGRRTPWILGGMVVLALGAILASASIAVTAESTWAGLALGVLSYLLIGAGVGAAGTTLLAMLAADVRPTRRAGAASIVWIMMIAGFIVTTATTAAFLDPFTPMRLLTVVSVVCAVALAVSVVALIGLEGNTLPQEKDTGRRPFAEVLKGIWDDTNARAFTIFVFVSMFAFGMQDLILEPFAGAAFNMTLGESTALSSMQHTGVLFGMIVAGLLAGKVKNRFGSIRSWTYSGCFASAAGLIALASAASFPNWPLKVNVFLLGFAFGVFAVSAIGWMMTLASGQGDHEEGSRMGLWGAAQAVGTALGGFLGAIGVDAVRLFSESHVALPYATIFALEGTLFIVAALLAFRMREAPQPA